MSNSLAVDTNVLIAYVDQQDKWNHQAKPLFEAVQNSAIKVFYFDCVINEAITAMARRAEEQKRVHQLGQLLDKVAAQAPIPLITWVSHDTERLYDEIVALVRQSGGTLNFHDALIALSCRELSISLLVSFDQDFDQLGWLTRIDTPAALETALAAE